MCNGTLNLRKTWNDRGQDPEGKNVPGLVMGGQIDTHLGLTTFEQNYSAEL